MHELADRALKNWGRQARPGFGFSTAEQWRAAALAGEIAPAHRAALTGDALLVAAVLERAPRALQRIAIVTYIAPPLPARSRAWAINISTRAYYSQLAIVEAFVSGGLAMTKPAELAQAADQGDG